MSVNEHWIGARRHGHGKSRPVTSAGQRVGLRLRAACSSAALLSVGVTACGSGPADVVAASPSPTLSAAPSPVPGPSPLTTAAAGTPTTGAAWSAAGASFGVDRAEWPETAAAAHAGLQRLPTQRHDDRRELSFSPADPQEDFGATAVVSYGQASLSVSQEYLTTDLDDTGKEQLFSANNLLAAQFSLGLACAKGSYRGTMPRMKGYPGPGVTEKPLRRDVWFSCRVDGAEGDENYRAHAVGWTSGKTAWLVVAPNEKAVRELVTDTHDALPRQGR
jgi:hypothetical protein